MRLIATLLLSSFLPVVAQRTEAREEATATLIEKLRRNPADLGRIGLLAKRSDDADVIPALRELFLQSKLTDAKVMLGNVGLRASQVIAITLFERGVRDDMYFDELARYARQAIASDPPPLFVTDPSGKEEPRKGHNPAADAWCADRGLGFEVCMDTAAAYLFDISILGNIRDPRAIPIFRAALKASSYGIVRQAALGLANLNDDASLSLIAEACSRFPPVQSQSIAISAMGFKNPLVHTLFDRYITDPETRTKVKQEWQRAAH